MKTSKLCVALASKAPFFTPARPASGTVTDPWPTNSRLSCFGRHSSNSRSMNEQQLLRFLQRGDDLLATNGRKIIEELLDGTTVLQIVEQILRRNARAGKHRHPRENLRIPDNYRSWSVG